MDDRDPDARAGGVERAGQCPQGRVEREERGDDADHVVEAGADRAGGDQREEGDGQADHEGEQRRGPDLLRGAADRGAEGGETGAAGDDRRDPEQEAAPVEVDEQPEPGEHQQRHDERDDDAEQDLLGEERRLGDEAAGQPAKAFSSRSSASEPATSRTVTNISVIVAATEIAKVSRLGVSPLTTSVSTLIGCVTEVSRSPAAPRLSAATLLNSITRSRSVEVGAVLGQLIADLGQDLLGVAEAEDRDAVAEEAEVAAVEQDLQVLGRDVGDLLGDLQVRLREQGVDPVVDEAGLDRVLLVDEHLDRRALRVEAGERLEAIDEVRRAGSARRARRPTRPSAGPPPRWRRYAFDALAELALGPDEVEVGAADLQRGVGGYLVEEGDARLVRAAAERETDQHCDRDRVEDEERCDQRRAPHDLQVLEE